MDIIDTYITSVSHWTEIQGYKNNYRYVMDIIDTYITLVSHWTEIQGYKNNYWRAKTETQEC
jgi:hypothetical protein